MSKYSQITDYLVAFLKDEVEKTGLKNVVVGLSGGLDSAVVAVLAHKAFDKNSTAYQAFKSNLELEIKALEQSYPTIKF